MKITQLNSSKARLDIVVHVDELLDEQNRQRVEYAMLKATGIEHARFPVIQDLCYRRQN